MSALANAKLIAMILRLSNFGDVGVGCFLSTPRLRVLP